MKIQQYKNTYGHMVVDCPFCNYVAYVRNPSTISPDPLRDLKRHMTNAAKNEAFQYMLDPEKTTTLHFNYYKDHTTEEKIIKLNKRGYDGDLELVK